ncbi:hypothetical protein GA0074692_3158 [Micromonospora pallida]|uniref:Uncharacterized protein n=1 Tax=Micromonospora pallida TaxID=145854 RepID=A0A1C6SQ21_9ACTN|nr:hypothetical protein GA0074692_3158 [Micromonospora pallida]
MWVALLVVGVALIGLGVFLGVTRLDDADKWGSVIAAMVAVLGLPMTAYGVVLARRQGSAAGGQSVAGSVVRGGVMQVRRVRGNVRIGPAASRAPAAAGGSPTSGTTGPGGPGGQSVTGSWMAGGVRQVDDVGGDVDVDR